MYDEESYDKEDLHITIIIARAQIAYEQASIFIFLLEWCIGTVAIISNSDNFMYGHKTY